MTRLQKLGLIAGATVALVATGFVAPGTAEAYPEYRRWAMSVYPSQIGCATCHVKGGGSMRNDYGRDWESLGQSIAAFAEAAKLDSDGDGISNGDEIVQGSAPGDPTSTPSNPGRYEVDRGEIHIPSEQLELVLPDADRFEIAEMRIDDKAASRLQSVTGDPVPPEERFPTLYFGTKNGRRNSVAVFGHQRTEEGRISLLVSLAKDGKIHRIAMFHAADSSPGRYRAYLNCLTGRGEDDIPNPGEAGCAPVKAADVSQKITAKLVRKVLATVRVLLMKG